MALRKSYDAELADIHQPYAEIAQWAGIDELRNSLMSVAGGPAVFIGTGGTFAIARFACMLHEQVGGQPARAVTPVELATLPTMTRCGAVLFSSGLSHPDALSVVERLSSNRLRPAVVVTLRDAVSAREIVPSDVEAVSLPPLQFREGFLATTSVLVMVAALIRAYAGDSSLPPVLPRPDVELPTAAEQLLVLTTPALAPVATDIETRFHELGLASVQVTDYRNFAHGRHVGLLRRAKTTSVLALVDESLERLAFATLNTLPEDEVDVTVWRAGHSGLAAVPELLIASMEMVASVASAQGVNPARPGAAPFGRRLYHLRLGRLLPPLADGPVERKLRALVTSLDADSTAARYGLAFDEWRERLADQDFGALVLDYDGTVCATGRRFELPERTIQLALISLLDHGVMLGFASGRGKSLFEDLRKWVPSQHWPRVTTGLYNGGAIVALDDELPSLIEPTPVMSEVVHRLQRLPISDALVFEPRSLQVTVSVKDGAYAQVGRLAELVVDTISRAPELPVKVVKSGHSIDVVPRTSSKRSVIERLLDAGAGAALAIGDQGDIGGNDFELLSSSEWTLTVDRCSADPSRCWYLGTGERSGPDLLATYLEATKPADGQFAMHWRVS